MSTSTDKPSKTKSKDETTPKKVSLVGRQIVITNTVIVECRKPRRFNQLMTRGHLYTVAKMSYDVSGVGRVMSERVALELLDTKNAKLVEDNGN